MLKKYRNWTRWVWVPFKQTVAFHQHFIAVEANDFHPNPRTYHNWRQWRVTYGTALNQTWAISSITACSIKDNRFI